MKYNELPKTIISPITGLTLTLMPIDSEMVITNEGRSDLYDWDIVMYKEADKKIGGERIYTSCDDAEEIYKSYENE